ncbi:MAG TPA: hypothetical protein VLV15_11375, partial [Dongiaceae bacterium]|nr:hypothetical protein [Dongiaceae bacterium]
EYTDTLAGGAVVLSRAIAVADSAQIPQPQYVPVNHDGIRNIHPGKSSVSYYWDEGEKRWITLVGAD